MMDIMAKINLPEFSSVEVDLGEWKIVRYADQLQLVHTCKEQPILTTVTAIKLGICAGCGETVPKDVQAIIATIR